MINKWIDVNDRLPENGNDVLCMMRTDEGKTIPVIRWRSEYDDTVVDSNGFIIYKPVEVKVVAWMEIPEYNHLNISEKPNNNSENVEIFTVNGVFFKMIYVDGGTFMMGVTEEQDSEAEDDEKPNHEVTLNNYYIAETQVTQELWQAVMGSNPSRFTGNLQRPVERISWNDCQEFIKKLNNLTGRTFRLPTEAEWEYAARGGSQSQGYKYAGSDNIDAVAWCYDNTCDKGSYHPDYGTHPVRQKQPNELGLYDMSGNVWEWCQDWYNNEYYSSSPQINPMSTSDDNYHVRRGGSWNYFTWYCRISNRNYSASHDHYSYVGFRLVLNI